MYTLTGAFRIGHAAGFGVQSATAGGGVWIRGGREFLGLVGASSRECIDWHFCQRWLRQAHWGRRQTCHGAGAV